MEEPIDISSDSKDNLSDSEQTEAVAAPERNFVTTGLMKGLAVTALLVVGVMALVAGASGAGSGSFLGSVSRLMINNNIITTFGHGAGGGITIALDFLVKSPIAWATMAVGGALGVYHEYKNDLKQTAAAPDTEDHAKICQLTQELELQKTMNKALAASQETVKAPEKRDSIYLANSTVQDATFRASELKRRVDAVNGPTNYL